MAYRSYKFRRVAPCAGRVTVVVGSGGSPTTRDCHANPPYTRGHVYTVDLEVYYKGGVWKTHACAEGNDFYDAHTRGDLARFAVKEFCEARSKGTAGLCRTKACRTKKRRRK